MMCWAATTGPTEKESIDLWVTSTRLNKVSIVWDIHIPVCITLMTTKILEKQREIDAVYTMCLNFHHSAVFFRGCPIVTMSYNERGASKTC